MRLLQFRLRPIHADIAPWRTGRPGEFRSMLAVLFGVFAAVCWSFHDLIARSMAAQIGAFRMAALVIISGGILLSFYVIYDGTLWSASWPQLMSGFLLGIAYGFAVGGLFKAFSLGPISLVGPITAGYPVLAVLWGVFNGLEPTFLQWSAVAATIVGAIIVARSGTEDGGINAVEKGKMPTLLFFAAMAVLGYSASIVLGQNAAVTVGEIEATWLSRVTAFLVLIPFIMKEGNATPLTRRNWAGIFVMGGLDVLGVIAVNASGHLPGKDFAGIGISAYGAVAVILAMIFLKEKVSKGQWFGIGMIVAGVATLSVTPA
jgi:drug/metabolite transporter (DMT)-like permease